jgi:hypothetical protein
MYYICSESYYDGAANCVSEPNNCAAGQFFSSSSNSCENVPAGYYNPVPKSSVYYYCPIVSAEDGATACNRAYPTLQPSRSAGTGAFAIAATEAPTGPTSSPTVIPACPAGTYYQFADDDYYVHGYRCVSCPIGYVAQANSSYCSACPAGYAPATTLDSCYICPLNSYSLEGSASCTVCGPGRITATFGATTETDCVNPISNYVGGFFCLGLCTMIGFIYVCLGRVHRLAFHRKERAVRSSMITFERVRNKMDYIISACNNVLSAQRKRKRGRGNHKNWLLKMYLKRIIFVFGGLLVVIICTLVMFMLFMVRAFYNSLIIYRGYVDVVKVEFIELLGGIITNIVYTLRLQYLAVIFYPIIIVFDYFAKLNLGFSFSSIQITCSGAQLPARMLTNLLVTGLVVVIIESNVDLMWWMSFYNCKDSFWKLTTNRFYFSSHKKATIFQMMGGLVVAFLPPPRSIMQYVLTVVKVRPFFSNDGIGEISYQCQDAIGVPLDAALAIGTSIVAYLLIVPIIHLMSQIIVPCLYADHERNVTEPETKPKSCFHKAQDNVHGVFKMVGSVTAVDWVFLRCCQSLAKIMDKSCDKFNVVATDAEPTYDAYIAGDYVLPIVPWVPVVDRIKDKSKRSLKTGEATPKSRDGSNSVTSPVARSNSNMKLANGRDGKDKSPNTVADGPSPAPVNRRVSRRMSRRFANTNRNSRIDGTSFAVVSRSGTVYSEREQEKIKWLRIKPFVLSYMEEVHALIKNPPHLYLHLPLCYCCCNEDDWNRAAAHYHRTDVTVYRDNRASETASNYDIEADYEAYARNYNNRNSYNSNYESKPASKKNCCQRFLGALLTPLWLLLLGPFWREVLLENIWAYIQLSFGFYSDRAVRRFKLRHIIYEYEEMATVAASRHIQRAEVEEEQMSPTSQYNASQYHASQYNANTAPAPGKTPDVSTDDARSVTSSNQVPNTPVLSITNGETGTSPQQQENGQGLGLNSPNEGSAPARSVGFNTPVQTNEQRTPGPNRNGNGTPGPGDNESGVGDNESGARTPASHRTYRTYNTYRASKRISRCQRVELSKEDNMTIMASVVGIRAILILLLPFCEIISIFASQTCASPWYVGEDIKEKAPDGFFGGAGFMKMMEKAKEEVRDDCEQLEEVLLDYDDWEIYALAISKCIEGSRFIQFGLNLMNYGFSVLIVFSKIPGWLQIFTIITNFITFFVIVVALVKSLKYVVYLRRFVYPRRRALNENENVYDINREDYFDEEYDDDEETGTTVTGATNANNNNANGRNDYYEDIQMDGLEFVPVTYRSDDEDDDNKSNPSVEFNSSKWSSPSNASRRSNRSLFRRRRASSADNGDGYFSGFVSFVSSVPSMLVSVIPGTGGTADETAANTEENAETNNNAATTAAAADTDWRSLIFCVRLSVGVEKIVGDSSDANSIPATSMQNVVQNKRNRSSLKRVRLEIPGEETTRPARAFSDPSVLTSPPLWSVTFDRTPVSAERTPVDSLPSSPPPTYTAVMANNSIRRGHSDVGPAAATTGSRPVSNRLYMSPPPKPSYARVPSSPTAASATAGPPMPDTVPDPAPGRRASARTRTGGRRRSASRESAITADSGSTATRPPRGTGRTRQRSTSQAESVGSNPTSIVPASLRRSVARARRESERESAEGANPPENRPVRPSRPRRRSQRADSEPSTPADAAQQQQQDGDNQGQAQDDQCVVM